MLRKLYFDFVKVIFWLSPKLRSVLLYNNTLSEINKIDT